MKCRTANASDVAAWSFSSSETRPRQKSEEMTSVALKCSRANVLLPEPGRANEHNEAGVRERDPHRLNTAILRRRSDLIVDGAHGQVANSVTGDATRTPSAQAENPRASTRSDGPSGEAPRGESPSARCTRRWVSSHDRRRPRRTRRAPLERSKARRVEVLDDLDESSGVESSIRVSR